MSRYSLLLHKFLEELRVERGLSLCTIQAYQCDLNQLLEWMDKRPITVKLHRLYVEFMKKCELSPRSISRKLTSIRLFYHYLYDQGSITFMPNNMLVTPKLNKRLPKVLHIGDVERMMSSPNTQYDQYPYRDRAILEVFYACGCRISEVSGILMSDIRDIGMIKICGKRKKERWVPLGSPAQSAIQDYLRSERDRLYRVHGPDYVFLNRFGNKMGRQSVYTIVKKYAARAGIDHMTPHMIRHTCATHLLDGQADIREVQLMLGHENIATTEIYTQVAKAALKKTYRRCHPRR